jgi:hypothetical protein
MGQAADWKLEFAMPIAPSSAHNLAMRPEEINNWAACLILIA